MSGVCPSLQIVFAKGAHYALKDLSKCGYDVVGVDWTTGPREARLACGDKVALQGNLDPCALYAPQASLHRSTHLRHSSACSTSGAAGEDG